MQFAVNKQISIHKYINVDFMDLYSNLYSYILLYGGFFGGEFFVFYFGDYFVLLLLLSLLVLLSLLPLLLLLSLLPLLLLLLPCFFASVLHWSFLFFLHLFRSSCCLVASCEFWPLSLLALLFSV